MSLDNYSDLAAEVQRQLGRSDTATYLPQAIAMTEALFNRRLRTFDMQATAVLNTAAEQDYVNLPTDAVDVLAVGFTGITGKLKKVSPQQYADMRAGAVNGKPKAYYLRKNQLILAPVPDAIYSLSIVYFEKIPALTEVDDENWLLTRHPDLYVQGVCAHFPRKLLGAELKGEYMEITLGLLQDIQDDADRFAAGGLNEPTPQGMIV